MTVISETVGHTLDYAREGMSGFERKVNLLEKRATSAVKEARARLLEARDAAPKRLERLGDAITHAFRGARVTRGEFDALVGKVESLAERVESIARKPRKPAANA